MGKKNDEDKQLKRQVKLLQDRAAYAFEVGDYRATRELDQQIIEMSPQSDAGRLASEQRRHLGVDPVVIKFGLALLALHLLGWVFALF